MHHPLGLRLREVVRSGELGAVRRIVTTFRMPAPPDTDPRWSWELAGGAQMDLGCYALHLHRFLGDRPRVVAAHGGERAGRPRVDEWLEAELEHADGVKGIALCDMAAPAWQITAYVVGERGQALAHNIVLPQRDDRLTVWIGDGVRVERLGTPVDLHLPTGGPRRAPAWRGGVRPGPRRRGGHRRADRGGLRGGGLPVPSPDGYRVGAGSLRHVP